MAGGGPKSVSSADSGVALPGGAGPPREDSPHPIRLRATSALQAVRTADDVEHDLVRTGTDPIQAHVAPDPLDSVLLHVAGAAVDLDALVGDLDRDARSVQLGHRDLADGVLAVLVAPGGRVDHLPRALDLRRHLGELVADHLELADLAAERGALLGVLQRTVEARLGAGDAAGGADQALALELPHDVVEALADLAEDRGRRDPDVLECQQRRVARVHAELLELLLADDAGEVHRHEEQREAVVTGLRVGLRDEHDHVGAVAVGDVGLRAVDDVVVAVAYRARLDAGHIGAGVGLGDTEAEDLLALDRRHDPLL